MRMKKLAVMALAAALSVGTVMTASAAWIQEGPTNWRYQNNDGTFQAGTWFKDVDGRWYHFDANGLMQKGWFLDADGKWYFLAYNGVMQVGLIKVDSQVYYMNPSGDLFLGDMAINGTTYNFGLYGTTNGQPSVPATATYGGNGNQSLSGGGSGSSSGGSGGGSGTQTPADKVESAVDNVNDAAEIAKGDSNGTIETIEVSTPETTGTNTAKVDVTVKAAKKLDLNDSTADKEGVVTAVSHVVSSVVDDADEGSDITVKIDGIKLPKETISKEVLETKIDDLVDKYITPDNYENASKATVVVTVNGVKVTYTITLSK